eukprot:357281-Chlamydomonas_euryale.AAC.10
MPARVRNACDVRYQRSVPAQASFPDMSVNTGVDAILPSEITTTHLALVDRNQQGARSVGHSGGHLERQVVGVVVD